VTNEERRIEVATRLRQLSHEFVAHALTNQQLEKLAASIEEIASTVANAEPRERDLTNVDVSQFKMVVPDFSTVADHQLFSDSFVSGGANPLGIGASFRREGDTAVMEVVLGKAFEGAPGRAHGGVVAALIDETMGLVLAIHGNLAFTAQLDVTYLAPTPMGKAIAVRAWLKKASHRKLFIEASVEAEGVVLAKAKALFITVDPAKFLEHLVAQPE
jgi:acyl-coenzyme A thioesterase PaaI-like protein